MTNTILQHPGAGLQVHLEHYTGDMPEPVPGRAGQFNERCLQLFLQGRPATTQDQYRRQLERFLRYTGGALLCDSGHALLADYLGHLQAQSDKPATVKAWIEPLRSFYSWACQAEPQIFTRNPCAGLRVPKAPVRMGGKVLAEQDLQAAMELRVSPLVKRARPLAGRDAVLTEALERLGYYTAGRVSWLVALTWADVTELPDGRAMFSQEAKGGDEHTATIQAEQWARLKPLLLELACGAPEPGLALLNEDGQAISRHQAYRRVKRAARAAGVKASPHTLRHCHGSHARWNGAPMEQVQQQLGHSSLAVTGQYTHGREGESSASWLRI